MTMMTVTQLIEHLKTLNPDAIVALDCEDHYYSNLLDPDDISIGQARRCGPYDWVQKEDHLGRKVNWTHTYPGGWSWRGDDDLYQPDTRGETLETRPCVIIHVAWKP